MQPKPHSALVLVGHGSTLNPDSSTPTMDHAETIRRRGVFGEVKCAFWKEEPAMREVLRMVDSAEIYVVPNFISEGYFTQQVIPRELGLEGRTSILPPLTDGGPPRRVHYCDPVGIHPSMTRLLLARAEEVAPDVPRAESALIIVGHGTGLNDNSTKAIKDQVALILASGAGFAEVVDAYMEEAPLVAGWDTMVSSPNVIVVPFFIADGLHSFQDIPVLLGIEEEITAAASQLSVFKQNPHDLRGRKLYYSSAIGTEPMLADVILDQVDVFDQTTENASPTTAAPVETLTEKMLAWLSAGGRQIGEVLILPEAGGWRVLHQADEAAAGTGSLTLHSNPAAALDLARNDAAGQFRPIKTAPTLKHGWELFLTTPATLHEALDFLYPAALSNWFRYAAGQIQPGQLKETLGRQTGMYRITGLLRADEAQGLVARTCHDGNCQRRILWTWDHETPWTSLPAEKTTCPRDPGTALPALPLLCTDACPLLIGPARPLVKDRLKAEADAAALTAAPAAS
jgi:sirohydrochlorin cobaltochelatase